MNVEQALSFGVLSSEDFWKIELLHPTDSSVRLKAWVPLTTDDPQIGNKVNNIIVAQPGVKLLEVMGWLDKRITRYPYYWPYEGTYVDRYGYDFQIDISSNNDVSTIELTDIAYEIIKTKLSIQPPDPASTTEVDIQNDIVSGGGVLIKLTLTLGHAQPVSELNIAPFTKYPMELVSLMYEEDIKTFHPKKEIVIPKDDTTTKNFEQTTQSIHFQFPAVTAHRFTIILRQQNAEKNTYLLSEDMVTKKELWDMISEREAEVTLDAADGLETVSQSELDKWDGWDIYMQQYAKWKKDMLDWTQKLNVYRQKQAEREAALEEKRDADLAYRHAMSEWRQEFNLAKGKWDAKKAAYDQAIAKYNSDYAKYQQNLKQYNDYIRDYNAWKAKWG
jgi:hypothetical protein